MGVMLGMPPKILDHHNDHKFDSRQPLMQLQEHHVGIQGIKNSNTPGEKRGWKLKVHKLGDKKQKFTI